MSLCRLMFIFYSCVTLRLCCIFFFFFNDTATTEIYTLSLHDALPIYRHLGDSGQPIARTGRHSRAWRRITRVDARRSEEHTSELQSRRDLVCRLLLEKKKKKNINKIEHSHNKTNSHNNILTSNNIIQR